MTPPSTTTPSGGPREASQGGKRSSSGSISALPSGDSPKSASSTRLVTTSQLASRVKRVNRRTSPTSPIVINRFEGRAKKPRTLEATKNIPSSHYDRDLRHAA